MTQEALKLALAALEINLTLLEKITPYKGQEDFLSDSLAITQDTITAIKEALAQEKALQALHSENERLGLYKDAYAQPEQEPRNVRERWNVELDGNDLLVCFNDHEKGDKCQYERYSPQRTWVGLAAEDRLTAKYMQDALDGIEAVIDYIEAKLKELNT